MSSAFLTLHEAADRLGVHYMTAYRYVRLGMLPAHKEGGQWRVAESDVDALHTDVPTPPRERHAPWGERLEARMIAGDNQGAWTLVESALASGVEPAQIYTELLAPALDSVGRRWAEGDIGVEHEHLASAVATRLIGRLGPRFARRGRHRGTVITALPPGERHGMGVAMLADVLRGERWDVIDLGPDTPAASAVRTLHAQPDVHVICLGLVYADLLPALRDMIEEIRMSVDRPVRVVVGGSGLDEHVAPGKVGADAYAESAIRAAELVGDFVSQCAG